MQVQPSVPSQYERSERVIRVPPAGQISGDEPLIEDVLGGSGHRERLVWSPPGSGGSPIVAKIPTGALNRTERPRLPRRRCS